VGPRNHVLDGMRLGATWQIQWIDLHDSDAGCSYRYCSHVSFIFTVQRICQVRDTFV